MASLPASTATGRRRNSAVAAARRARAKRRGGVPRSDIRRQILAVNRVERLLASVSAALDAAGVPYAVIGGNAVAAWVTTVDEGAVRATKDVDTLLRRKDLDAASEALSYAGLIAHQVFGGRVFLDRHRPNPRTGVHVVFAKERVRPGIGHVAPDVRESVRAAAGYRVINLPALIRMKLDAFRHMDQVHLEDLLSVGLITPRVVRSLPRELRRRLAEIVATRRE